MRNRRHLEQTPTLDWCVRQLKWTLVTLKMLPCCSKNAPNVVGIPCRVNTPHTFDDLTIVRRNTGRTIHVPRIIAS